MSFLEKSNLKLFCLLMYLSTRRETTSIAEVIDDENRPYEFSFNIVDFQHRYERKDADGIVTGEYGFITADGVYHETGYATDKNGDFLITRMRNRRIGNLKDAQEIFKDRPEAAKRLLKAVATSCSGCKIPIKPKEPPSKAEFPSKKSDKDPISSIGDKLVPVLGEMLKVLTARVPMESIEKESAAVKSDPRGDLMLRSVINLIPDEARKRKTVKDKEAMEVVGEMVKSAKSILSRDHGSRRSGKTFDESNGQINNQQRNIDSNANSYDESNVNSNDKGNANSNNKNNDKSNINSDDKGNVNSNNKNNDKININSDDKSNEQSNIDSNDKSNEQSNNNNKSNINSNDKSDVNSNVSNNVNSNVNGNNKSNINSNVKSNINSNDKSNENNNINNNNDKNNINSNDKSNDEINDVVLERMANDLYYSFNYTIATHGHHEDGYRSGSKDGSYQARSQNGVDTHVRYLSNEFGHQPNITYHPNENSTIEETGGLKGYSFVWYWQ